MNKLKQTPQKLKRKKIADLSQLTQYNKGLIVLEQPDDVRTAYLLL
jgi:hypothetical protein